MALFGERTALEDGLAAFQRKQWRRARARLEEAALNDERTAAYHLGLLYWRGLGGGRDQQVAVYWFRRAAEAELPAAQDALAVALRSGQGVAQDRDEAKRLFTAAAERGHAPAMVNLATMCPPAEARRWLTRAAETGYEPAILHLSDLIEPHEPGEALAWLYACVALTGHDGATQRAKALARDLSASAIAAAQRRGRSFAKEAAARRGL